MSFSRNNKFVFIDSFQFVRSSLDSVVKHLGKDDFKYLSQEFDSEVLDPGKRKECYPYKYMNDPIKSKEQLTSKEKFYTSLTDKTISDKEYEHVLQV